jgi:D-alanyl-D-alanine carboxypeptidase
LNLKPYDPSITWAGFALSLENHVVLLRHNDTLRVPVNSVQKVYTASVALARMGGLTQSTQVYQCGCVRGGVLDGSILIRGGGDPFLATSDFDLLSDAVVAAGIRRIAGPVFVDESRYDSRRSVDVWDPHFMPLYCGPLSACTVDENRVRGYSPAVLQPQIWFAGAFASSLRRHGVFIDGGVQEARADLAALPVAEKAAPLTVTLRRMLWGSSNVAAELVLKEIGARDGNPTTSGGLGALGRTVRDWGLEVGPFVDGSGLSCSNRQSVSEQVALLDAVRSATSGGLAKLLPTAGLHGTLASRLRRTCGEWRVRAKSGSRPRVGAGNLAGFAKGCSGHEIAFALWAQASCIEEARRHIDRVLEQLLLGV